MGSSVFHGGFSTFLAISVLGLSKSYVFECFFKCWVAIIFFGMCNGFFLLPVILSFCGPTVQLIKHEEDCSADQLKKDTNAADQHDNNQEESLDFNSEKVIVKMNL